MDIQVLRTQNCEILLNKLIYLIYMKSNKEDQMQRLYNLL